MPLLFVLALCTKPVRQLLGGLFILYFLCLGLLVPIHQARLNAVHVEKAIGHP